MNDTQKEVSFMVNLENEGYNIKDINDFLTEHYENQETKEYNLNKFKKMHEVEE
jgi:hypothetical protein